MESYSVLMSVYSGEEPEHLKQSIGSMKAQTLPFARLILVCDGPLGKELEDVIAAEAGELRERFFCLRLPERKGLGNALRAGLLHCETPFVARMDSDDLSRPDRCEQEMARLLEGYDLVGGYISEFALAPGDRDSCRKVPLSEDEIRGWLPRRNPFNHVTVMFRRESVLRAGGYQPFEGFEDYCLWVRLLGKGHSCKACNLPKVMVDVRTGSGFAARRGSFSYAGRALAFQRYLRREGIIGVPDLIRNCLMRVTLALLPARTRNRIYARFLRENIRNENI